MDEYKILLLTCIVYPVLIALNNALSTSIFNHGLHCDGNPNRIIIKVFAQNPAFEVKNNINTTISKSDYFELKI